VWLLLIDIVAYSRYGFHPNLTSGKVKALFWFVMIHNFLWIFIVHDIQSSYFSAWVSAIITLGSIFIVSPVIEFGKLKRPLYFFAIIITLGLLYQYVQLSRGNFVSQLVIPPFEPAREVDTTKLLEFLRPSSFMSEPADFCNYMYLPMFILLLERKYVYVFLFAIANLLSTSTTGLVISFLMIGVYFLTQKVSFKWKLLVMALAVGVALLFLNTDIFEKTMTKVENTDLSENERTSIGFHILPQLSTSDILFGISYANITDMHKDHKIVVNTFIEDDGTVFVPSFWAMLFQYGVFGLIIYLLIYWDLFRRSRLLLPFLICMVVRLFSTSDTIGANYFFQLCIMYSFIRYEKKTKAFLNA